MEQDTLTETMQETLALFSDAGTPLTTTEVADRLDLGRRAAYGRLERLVERGRLETKKVGANARVWWRPGVSAERARPKWPAAAESLVDDILDDVEVGMVVLDEDFDVAWLNEATEQYFDIDRERVIGQDEHALVDEYIAPVVEDSDGFAETVLATYDDNTDTERFECRVTGADGEDRWLEHRSKPIEAGAYAGGRVELYYDVTAQRESEQEHHETERRFRTLVDVVEEYAIFMLDPDGHVQTWNEGAARIKGYEADEIVGEHFSTFYTDADREAGVSERNLDRAAAEGVVTDEGWRIRADGSRFWAHVTITAIHDDDGDLQGFAKVTRDMTDRREREQQLRRERDMIERVLETVPVGVSVVASDEGMVRTNERATEILGGDPGGAFRGSDHRFYDTDGDPIPDEKRPYRRVLETGDPVFDWRGRIDHPDGKHRWLSVNAAPLEGEDGAVEHVVVAGEDVTQLEEQARRLERQRDDIASELEEVMERIDDGFFALDGDLRFTYVNNRAGDFLEWSPAGLVGRHIWDAFDPGPEAEAAFEEALETGQSVSFEAYYEPLERWFENRVYPSETGLSVYVRDVTDRKEREQRLERYVRIIDAVNEPVYELDAEGRLTFVNDAFVEYSGYEERDLLGRHVSIGMDDEAIAKAEAKMEELLANDPTGQVTLEYDVISKDGDRIPVENRISLLFDDDGRIRGSAGILWDITGRRERERELELYETVVATIEDGVYVMDEEYRFTMVNDTYCEMTGYDREDLLGAHSSLVVSDDVTEESYQRLQEIAAGDADEATIEADILRADGSRLRAESRFTALPTDETDAREPWKVGVVRDVSERVERERELERQRERLDALNSLNTIVWDITDAVIDQSTREEIEAIVCERLAEADSYEFAWIGEVDAATQTITPRVEAGVEGYVENVPISVDPDDPGGQGPAGEAVQTGEMQVVRDTATDPAFEPWTEVPERYGYRSVASIPIEHEGTFYGLLGVYADRPGAFDGEEGEVIGQLGEVVGHAIAAAERKQALMSDELVELEFQIRDVFTAIDIPVDTSGTITLDNAVPLDDGEFLVYGTATPDAVDTVTSIAETLPHWRDLTIRSEGDPTNFEVRMTEPPVLSVVASLGGSVEQAVIEDGDYQMTIHLAPSVDVRQITDAVEAAYPAAQMLRRRQISRDRDDAERVQRHLIDTLTDRQHTALETAYYAGFFEWPREATGEEVAASIGVAPSTFHQHLRKGQRKVFETVFASAR